MITSKADGTIIYRSTKAKCLSFPLTGDDGSMKKGIPRNFHIYEPLEFLAEITQHIPNKGEHQVRYYGLFQQKAWNVAETAQWRGRALPWFHRTRHSCRPEIQNDLGGSHQVRV
jgi:hypothetical protein